MKRRDLLMSVGGVVAGVNSGSFEKGISNFINFVDFRKNNDSIKENLDVLSVAINKNKNLYFPEGEYEFLLKGKGVDVNFPVSMFGAGSGKTRLNIYVEEANYLFNVRESFFNLSDIDICIINLKNKNFVILCFSGHTKNHCLSKVRFYCPESNGGVGAHGIFVENNSKVSNVKILCCEFRVLNYGIFSSNNFNGMALDWNVDSCLFYKNRMDDIELNSLDNPNKPWKFVSIINNVFYDWGGIENKNSGFAIGLESVEGIVVTNNKIYNYKREAIHVEDCVDSVLIANNVIKNCVCGIYIYQKQSFGVLVSGNILINNGLKINKNNNDLNNINNLKIGICFANPGVFSSSTSSSANDNIVSGYEIGIYCPVDRGGDVKGNTVSNCLIGLYAPKRAFGVGRNNKIYNCKYAIFCKGLDVQDISIVDCAYMVAPGHEMTFIPGCNIEARGVSVVEGALDFDVGEGLQRYKIFDTNGTEIKFHLKNKNLHVDSDFKVVDLSIVVVVPWLFKSHERFD